MSDRSGWSWGIMASLISVIAVGLVTPGCISIHSDKNRPGTGDIRQAPDTMEQPERLVPGDPGADLVAASGRVFTSMGWASMPGGRQRTHPVGFELSVGKGEIDRLQILHGSFGALGSHLIGGVIGGQRGYLVDSQRWRTRIYAEVDSRLVGLVRTSAGWSLQPDAQHHGPQVTLGFGHVFHGRWNWDMGHGWALTFGVSLPIYAIYSRSR